MPGAAARQANLDLLCGYASGYEATQGGALNGFLAYVREIRRGGEDLNGARALGEEDQVVRLMTIHKSKGLEFPVVFAPEMGRRLSAAGHRGEFLAHRALGAGIRLNDPVLSTSRQTLAQAAIAARLAREDYNEEMRILYVLLTRAIDRLILVGRASRKDARLRFELCGAAGLRPENYLEAVRGPAPRHGARRADRVARAGGGTGGVRAAAGGAARRRRRRSAPPRDAVALSL
jgi:ATP-dependent helicase/nuclease subunit A